MSWKPPWRKIWADVLGRDTVGVEDNFFTLGGHSLLATQIVARLRTHFKLDLPLRVLFEQPTVALLAVAIAARQADAAAPQAAVISAPKAQPRPSLLPLSFSQQRLWFIEQLTPGTTLFNIPFALHLKGELNVEALHASLNDLLVRHEILRTGIRSTDGVPSQHISESLNIALPFDDLSGLAATAREGAQFNALQETFEQPFDLTSPPLLRARLLRVAPGEHVLGIALHHMVSDAWSATIALRELALGYEARCNGAPRRTAGLAGAIRRLRPVATRTPARRRTQAPARLLDHHAGSSRQRRQSIAGLAHRQSTAVGAKLPRRDRAA